MSSKKEEQSVSQTDRQTVSQSHYRYS